MMMVMIDNVHDFMIVDVEIDFIISKTGINI